jgi:glutamate-ammonia-ligase adenylyltransferase
MRDNPVAAERLCRLLGTSRLLGRLIDRIPPAMTRLGDDTRLAGFPDPEDLREEAGRRIRVHPDPTEAGATLSRFADTHLLWIASQDLAGFTDEIGVGYRLSDAADAAVGAALDAAAAAVAAAGEDPPPLAVLALGKWGGRELNYASDLDGLVVFDAPDGDERAAAAAFRVVETALEILDHGGDGPGFDLDLDLRPEGRTGPPARSVASYLAYWDRWAETWETQALLRARPAAGDGPLGAALADLATAHIRAVGFGPAEERAVREMKVRIEQERIPPDEDPGYHMKLGRGGLADVEWAVQLLQLRHRAAEPGILEPGTLPALRALGASGLLGQQDAAVLEEAYRFCARVRNRLFLQAGRARDSLPVDPAEVTRLARSLGYTSHPRTALREEYRRVTRRARRVFERIFFGEPGNGGGHTMSASTDGA